MNDGFGIKPLRKWFGLLSSNLDAAELDGDLVIGFGGELDLLQVDPFVLGVGLGDVAGSEDDAR